MSRESWHDYWQQAPQSAGCFPSAPPDVQNGLRTFWDRFSATLPKRARVLDLACGDGAVLRHISTKRDDCALIGVDYARSSDTSGSIEIVGETDCTALPFEAESFDAIVSQFGLEYAGDAASAEAARVLKPGGSIGFIIHAGESRMIAHNAARSKALEAILRSNVLANARNLPPAEALTQASAIFRELLSAMRDQSVIREIGKAIELALANRATGRKQLQMIEAMARSERARLNAMIAAACDAEHLEQLLNPLRQAGVDIAVAEIADNAAGHFAWAVTGILAD